MLLIVLVLEIALLNVYLSSPLDRGKSAPAFTPEPVFGSSISSSLLFSFVPGKVCPVTNECLYFCHVDITLYFVVTQKSQSTPAVGPTLHLLLFYNEDFSAGYRQGSC